VADRERPIGSRRVPAPLRKRRHALFGCGTLLVAILIGTLSGAAGAGAYPTLVTSAYQLGGIEKPSLALDGDATLVGAFRRHGPNVVRSFAPGQPSHVVARVSVLGGSGEMLFAASRTRIALLDVAYYEDGGGRLEALKSGLLGGTLEPLPGECEFAPGLDEATTEAIPPHSIVAVDGEVVAYDTYRCVIVRDFASGVTRAREAR
jgi:hypothetical protein